MQWDDLRVLLATFRSASLTRASAELGVSVSTVSRRIAALEETLGQALFARTPEGLVPTPTASTLAAHAERVERVMLEAEDALVGLEEVPAGEVRLSAPDDMTHLVLIPALRPLLTQHPALRLEIRQGLGLADLTRREADIAVRIHPPAHGEELLVTRLRDVHLGIYATPEYLQSVPQPADPRAHRWISCTDDHHVVVSHPEWMDRATDGLQPVLKLNNPTSVRLAAAAGLGVAVLPCLFAALTPGLVAVPLSTEDLPAPMPLYMVTHRAIRHSARVRAVWEFLDALLRERRAQ
jgi:DNA-binding transcriptional LysR family regulator